MPAIGDVLRVPLRIEDPNGGQTFNIFHFTIDDLAVNTWQAVADDIADWLDVGYNPWMANVSDNWQSQAFEILVRDVILGQWNQVHSQAHLDIEGQVMTDSGAPLTTATFVSYPGSVRHWGFKNMPSPADGASAGGELVPAALVDLLVSAVLLSTIVTGGNTILRVGVYALASETFRGFTGTVQAGSPIGSRVTRKVGRGI